MNTIPESRFGEDYAQQKGFIVCADNEVSFSPHIFGGQSWKILASTESDQPALIAVFNLDSNKLKNISGLHKLTELPLVSYINSSAIDNIQLFDLDIKNKVIKLYETPKDIDTFDIEDRLPNPLPERCLILREMDGAEYPTTDFLYSNIVDSFLGGDSIFRLFGKPLWIQQQEEFPVCPACKKESKFIACIGYENWAGPYNYLDDQPLFFGELVLYFFICEDCNIEIVMSQST